VRGFIDLLLSPQMDNQTWFGVRVRHRFQNFQPLQHPEIVMTDLDYLNHAESALKAIEIACDTLNDETDADLDNQRVGGMITLTFANRSQIVINLQKPLHEIWLAAKRGGYHFQWREGFWTDTKTGAELFGMLSELASEQAGTPLVFAAPPSTHT